MSTQSDNFINELKYDAIKNNIKDFLSGNIKKILILLLLILAIYLTRYIIVNHRKNKILNYNSKIFESSSSFSLEMSILLRSSCNFFLLSFTSFALL